MIPKIIHFCWFGHNEYPNNVKKSIESWKKYCPDYEIKCWTEENVDFSNCKYAQEALAAKKWAFVSDYVRAYVLYEYGGIYMDADMLVLKNFDFVLKHEAFCSLANPGIISMGLLGFERKHPIIKEHLDTYKNRSFIKNDGTYDLTTNVTVFSNQLRKMGLGYEDKEYCIGGIHIYPTEYFYPTDFEGYRCNFTDNTCAEHLHSASWLPISKRVKIKIKRKLRRFFLRICRGK